MNQLEGIKVGDKVWAWGQGWGVISNVASTDVYPVRVKFASEDFDIFTKDGKRYTTDDIPSLFWGEIIVTYPTRPAPKVPWNLVPIDTKVMIDFILNGSSQPRHYAGEPKTYFIDGQTSFTTTYTDTCIRMKLAETIIIDGITYPEGSE